MAKQLNTSVHVVELSEPDARGNREVTNQGVFGPGDDLPAWAEKAITNPDVWVDSDDPQDAPANDGPANDGPANDGQPASRRRPSGK